MKKTNYLSILLLSLVVFASSCKKGDMGPAGAKGTTGATGTAGTAGTAGAAGTNGTNGTNGATGATGTANVIWSDWIAPISSYQFQKITSNVDGQYLWRTLIYDPALTSEIMNTGTVLVYIRIPSDQYGDTWTDRIMPLPFSMPYTEPITIGTGVTAQTINLPRTDSWTATVNPVNSTGTDAGINFISVNFATNSPKGNTSKGGISDYVAFRYVIIPGGVHTLGSVNPKNYQQVAQALHIPN